MFNKFRLNKIVTVIAGFYLMVGCSNSIKQSLGLVGAAPDEFRVVSNPPLVVPPEFNLRPPMPGAKGPLETNLQDDAKNILFEKSLKSEASKESKGEEAFLKKANTEAADAEIKESLLRDQQAIETSKKKEGVLGKVSSYFVKKDPVINAEKEKKRIEKNKKEGKPVNEGEVMEKEPNQTGLLNKVFGF